MASSSSSFHSTPPTSWKYDVFISFRGTDTRYAFVDHLYKALVDQGIGTFKDDQELPRGETIRPSLLNAIEDSHIAVVVFSENYADSSWCLQELEHIMKCKVERGQVVIPIFYHVDPSDIRNQKRKYGETFSKHESEKKNVDSWRKALFDAGNLSGHVPNGPETTFIENIVKDIFEKLCMAIPSGNEEFIGMEGRLQDLKSKMAIDSEGVLMVGIWGLGGGGKTTLARALYDQISTKFDGCCFMNNIREESRRQGLKDLQREILSCVLKKQKPEIVGDVSMLIKTRLRHKKVLLVLDDVDDANQLKALAVSHLWFNEGSRIIITTRDKHLLNIHKVNVIYNISLLNHDEAMKLFAKHALRHDNHIEDYDSLSNKVVSYSRGLPLAIKVLGSLLCDKDRSEWDSALARLQDIPEDDILETLKISYDGLKPVEKELFLDIACFFRGDVFPIKPWEVLGACGFHPKIGVRALIEKALITVSEEGQFDMHDLIQEMGHYIVRGKYPQNPEKHSRVWEWEDVLTICATPNKNHWIEALYVPLTYEESWGRTEVPHSLPHAIANMKKLRWIICYGYLATPFTTNFQSSKLCYLHLGGSLLEQLWEGYQRLPYLKVLNLSYSTNLISTPDFDGLPCLERIILSNCKKLTYIHPSISHHERLIYVDMLGCEQLKVFPPISGMKKLENLLLSWCSQLCEFPEIQGNMDNMVELSMRGTGIKVVPSSIGQYCTKLISLDFRGCESLESIEGNFHPLEHLKEFCINGFIEKPKIPAEGLFDVNLHPRIVSMNFLCFPPSLRKLSLRSCNWINEDTASALRELSNLQELDLSGNTFSRLNCSLLQLSSLKFLNLSSCKNLVELPVLPASIAILKAKKCNSLTIADLPTDLKWLYRISLPMESVSGDGEREVQSMLQGNAINDYSISLCFHSSTPMPTTEFAFRTSMLDLPTNWYNEFSGFLICIEDDMYRQLSDVITIKDIMGREDEDVLEVVSDGSLKRSWYRMCYIYIPFGSLKHTSCWKSTHTTISFSIQKDACLKKVELVPGRSKGDSIERVKDATNSSEFWDMEPTKIKRDSKTCIEIQWTHSNGGL